MISKLLDSDAAQAGGVLTVVGSVLANVYEFFTSEDFNNSLEVLLALGGAIFLFYKIRGQMLSNRKLKKEIEDLKDNNGHSKDSE